MHQPAKLLFLSMMFIGACESGMTQTASAEAPSPFPPTRASGQFHRAWSDGKAELSGYRLITSHYGQQREGTVVMIYVTEDLDRRTWIKDDRGEVPKTEQVKVLKLNRLKRFPTGIYDYASMTSVFSPVDSSGRERFAPVRITSTVQEWCGQTYYRLMPRADRFTREVRSYFSVDGESVDEIKTAPYALYEDALLIQLRELDGPAFKGDQWSGELVPSLWNSRKHHRLPQSTAATITREAATEEGRAVNRFTITHGDFTLVLNVERAAPRRIISWNTSTGEQATLLKTVRLPYWNLNKLGDESYLKQLGLAQ